MVTSTQKARVAYVCEGDINQNAFSGTAKSMVDHLRGLGHEIHYVNVRPSKPWLLYNALQTFSFDRRRWRSRFRYEGGAFGARSVLARRGLANLRGKVDVVMQVGASFTPPIQDGLPYVLYCDWSMALSMRHRDNPQSAPSGLSLVEQQRANEREKAVYRGAARIFTISGKLRESLIEDYQLRPERVVLAYAGANVDLSGIPERPAQRPTGRPPTVLFIANEFHRKGGDVLLRSFRLVRQSIPNAQLTIVGADPNIQQEGVNVVGTLQKHIPEQRSRLYRAFADADVFCLPTRIDPFPNVVREAMFFNLPCVTTDIFAMPEMVVDGETGFTVPVDDADRLASRLVQILQDDALAQRMGRAGRQRAERLFTWSNCARIIHEHLEGVQSEAVSQ